MLSEILGFDILGIITACASGLMAILSVGYMILRRILILKEVIRQAIMLLNELPINNKKIRFYATYGSRFAWILYALEGDLKGVSGLEQQPTSKN